jgi:hypothetical protein
MHEQRRRQLATGWGLDSRDLPPVALVSDCDCGQQECIAVHSEINC